MGEVETELLKSEFLNELNTFNSNLKFTYETSSCTVNFLRSKCKLKEWGNT